MSLSARRRAEARNQRPSSLALPAARTPRNLDCWINKSLYGNRLCTFQMWTESGWGVWISLGLRPINAHGCSQKKSREFHRLSPECRDIHVPIPAANRPTQRDIVSGESRISSAAPDRTRLTIATGLLTRVKRKCMDTAASGANRCRNSPSRARTYNLAVNSRSLYLLSYRGIAPARRHRRSVNLGQLSANTRQFSIALLRFISFHYVTCAEKPAAALDRT